MIASINPATGDIVATFDSLTESQLDEKLARVGAQSLDIAALTFGVERVEREAGLSGSAGSGEDHELSLRDGEILDG